MLKHLTKLLNGDDDTITIKLKKQGAKIRVVVTPSLGALPDDASEAMQKAHEAFSMPLLIVEKADDIESALDRHIEGYLPQHNEAGYAVEHINRLVNESAKVLKEKGVTKPKTNKRVEVEQSESEDEDDLEGETSMLDSEEKDY